jgi:dTDP-4-amino-4,6-dideoxygalactose transaminase
MKVPILDLATQYQTLQAEIDAAVLGVLKSGAYVTGPQGAALEAEMAALCGTRHAVAVASGTDALMLSLAALGVGQGDEIITTPFTFFAPAEVTMLRGARPVFVDIDPATFNLAPAGIEAAITPRTVGILPVHLYGQAADMTAIMAVAERHGLWVIEDNAQAIGARHAGRPTGSFGRTGCLSFYPTKNLGAFGDAGMIVTDDTDLAGRLRLLRNHGSAANYQHEYLGYNSRLDEIQSAILRVKLTRLPEWMERRRAHAARYEQLLAGSGVRTPAEAPGNLHVYHQYAIRAPRRDALQKHLAERQIDSRVYYPSPLHLAPACATLGYGVGSFPESERAAAEVLCLPIHPELSDAQVVYVATSIQDVMRDR